MCAKDGRSCSSLMFVFLGLAIAVAVSCPVTGRSAPPHTIDPNLQTILQVPDHPLRAHDGRVAVWVHFRERDLTPAQRELALERAAAILAPDVARRRAKTARPGKSLVDVGDLALDPGHLAAAAATGAELRRQSRWLNAASYNATDAQIRSLAALPQVRRVDMVWSTLPIAPVQVQQTQRPTPQEAPSSAARWTLDYGPSLAGLELINVPPVHELGYTGAGVKLAMMDTGFRLTHDALDHLTVLAQYDFAGLDGVVDYEPGDPIDSHEHGTQVISTAVGYAPGSLVGPAYNAAVILVRAEDTSLTSPIEEDWWVAGLEWAEAQGADLVSSSLGYWFTTMESHYDGNTAASTIAADMAAARGLLLINGAGNQGGSEFDVIVAPADGDSVVAVGATDVNGIIALGSSSGPTYDGRIKPDVVAQGIQVPVVDPNDDLAYGIAGGTSFSGPFVAAVAALVLERAPFLDPFQVREALRETADRHDTPDTNYGWGMVNALEAVFYWGPKITHTPLADTEDTVGPYTIEAVVTDQFPLAAQPPTLYYRLDAGQWLPLPMNATSGGGYATAIPGQPTGTTVAYYFEAADTQGLTARLPRTGPVDAFAFAVWQDVIPPEIVHAPLGAQPLATWPPAVTTAATDNLGIAEVTVTFSVNGGPANGPHPLLHGQGDVYARKLPLDAADLSVGDLISYTITATDASLARNQTQSGPHTFGIIGSAGRVLLVDDASGEGATTAGWLDVAGYVVTVKTANTIVAGDFVDREIVVLVSGSNPTPLANSGTRSLIASWVGGGGRLLIEGGETGYAALVYPGYGSFGANVLHASGWLSDYAGPLSAPAQMASHALLTQPLAVLPPVGISYGTESDQDALTPMVGTELVLENANIAGSGGAIVYDPDPVDPAAQVVYFPFALSALTNQSQAQALVINAAALLSSTALPSAVDEGPAKPSAAQLLGVTPNPFNAQTLVSIVLAVDGTAQLDIYDVRGHRIRRLLDGDAVLSARRHDIRWDGRDDGGRAVGSGVYFVRLTANNTLESRKLVLLR